MLPTRQRCANGWPNCSAAGRHGHFESDSYNEVLEFASGAPRRDDLAQPGPGLLLRSDLTEIGPLAQA